MIHKGYDEDYCKECDSRQTFRFIEVVNDIHKICMKCSNENEIDRSCWLD